MNSEFCVAVHGLVFLSLQNRSHSSETMAENICTNPARVRKVMAKLKKAGLVSTKEGVDGGYSLRQPPSEISLRKIGEALEHRFVCSNWHSGSQDMDCMVASGMADVMDQLYAELDGLCRQRLEDITVADVAEKILQKNDNRERKVPQAGKMD